VILNEEKRRNKPHTYHHQCCKPQLFISIISIRGRKGGGMRKMMDVPYRTFLQLTKSSRFLFFFLQRRTLVPRKKGKRRKG
jgi:hypothetical protein